MVLSTCNLVQWQSEETIPSSLFSSDPQSCNFLMKMFSEYQAAPGSPILQEFTSKLSTKPWSLAGPPQNTGTRSSQDTFCSADIKWLLFFVFIYILVHALKASQIDIYFQMNETRNMHLHVFCKMSWIAGTCHPWEMPQENHLQGACWTGE